jgi:hypothetical protein
MTNPWTDGGANNNGNDNSDDPILSSMNTLQAVPSHWTTKSGKFDPKQSELGFDARSNAAINIDSPNKTGDDSVSTFSNDRDHDSEYMSNTSDETKPKNNKNKEKKRENSAPLDGEIENAEERYRFYKKLKKAGIKKTFTIEDDWETSSTSSDISEISMGNASFILDLAQQKECRKKDREEEALEEALELYGTWLTEGKNDDKNIFLMILHEVKKEQKTKYKKADKKHAALLDAALDEELKRRERIKLEEKEDKERAKAAAAAAAKKKEADTSISNRKSSNRRASGSYSRQTESKISQMITSQRDLSFRKVEDKESGEDNSGAEFSGEGSEHSERSESTDHATEISTEESTDLTEEDLSPKKPSSKTNLLSRSKSKFFGWSRHNGKEQLPISDPEIFRKSPHPEREDSRRMFSHLRKQLSEKQAKESKEEENKWNSNSKVMTNEEKWWSKINDAKKGKVLFDQSYAMLDLTARTAPKPISTPNFPTSRDLSTRTAPVKLSSSKVAELSARMAAPMLPTISSFDTDSTDGTGDKKVKNPSSPKKKKGSKTSQDVEEKKKKKKKDDAVADGTNKSKDAKKKKKKSKYLESDDADNEATEKSALTKKKEEKKKKEKSKDGSKKEIAPGAVDESDSRSTRSGRRSRKTKDHGEAGDLSITASATKKKKDGRLAQKIEKKKKKKKPISTCSSSDDGDNASLDWTDRCINASQSDETGEETQLTMDSGLQ